MAVNVYGYTRVSTENQVKEGYSLEYQEEKIKEYCKENGYTLVEIFKDEGVSGAKFNIEEMAIERDGLVEMLSGVKEHDIKYIVVLNTSRLWRENIVKAVIQTKVKRLGIDIKVIDRANYTIYNNNPNDILTNGIFELIDVYERSEITTKLKRGRLQKAKTGEYCGGGVPFGYMVEKGSKKIEINQAEAEVVRRVYELKKEFPFSTLKEIADILNEKGYTSKNGKRINIMLVRRIFNNADFYRGIYSYGGVKAEGKHEPIIWA